MSRPDFSHGTIQVDGLKQLRRTLRAAGDDLSDLKEVNLAAARIAAQGGKSRAPIGPTGRLAASIRPAGTKTAGIVRAGKKSVPYAHAVHWGRQFWPNKEHARARSVIECTQFLSDGASDTEATWVPLYEDRINTIINTIEGT